MSYHHDGSALYVSTPTPSLGETVTVFVRGPAASGARVFVRSTPDGEPRFSEAVVDRTASGETWWRAEVEVRNPVTHYRFLLSGAAGYHWLTGLGTVDHDVPDDTDFRLVADAGDARVAGLVGGAGNAWGAGPDGTVGAPGWAADAIVYQIFPDRFARSAAAAGRTPPGWAIPCDWDTPVIGSGPQTPFQFYGGDLDGIAEHLDHIEALGANTVYLTPVFPARSNHRYDAASFDRVDPLLGGDAALDRLADAVHRRGMRLVGDITTNHTGDAHPWFSGPDRDELYYTRPDGGYESWLGVPSLPKLDWGSAELRRRFFAGADSVTARWLRYLDGWRVDVANMTGRLGAEDRTHEVARLMAEAVRAAKPDALLVAENAHDATGDLDRGGWQGTMDYAGFTRPVWSWLVPDAGTAELDEVTRRAREHFLGVPARVPRLPGTAMVATARAFAARMSWRSYTASWNLLGSHDTPRVRTVLGSAELVEVGAGLLATMPGTPMLFAGDELGMIGFNGEDSRRPMPWHRPQSWDRATLGRYQALLRLRTNHEALRHGGLRYAAVTDDAIAFWRETAGQRLLVAVRRAAGAPLPIGVGAVTGAENLYGGARLPIADEVAAVPGDGPGVQVWACD